MLSWCVAIHCRASTDRPGPVQRPGQVWPGLMSMKGRWASLCIVVLGTAALLVGPPRHPLTLASSRPCPLRSTRPAAWFHRPNSPLTTGEPSPPRSTRRSQAATSASAGPCWGRMADQSDAAVDDGASASTPLVASEAQTQALDDFLAVGAEVPGGGRRFAGRLLSIPAVDSSCGAGSWCAGVSCMDVARIGS
jgi:hypothetical protein